MNLIYEALRESILVELGVVLDSPSNNNRIVEVWGCDIHIEMGSMELHGTPLEDGKMRRIIVSAAIVS
jgi:hypothetical protein